MNNKYQVALNKIINHKCYEKESSCWDYVKTIYKEETDTLQELVDKENRMKEIQKGEDSYCPRCKALMMVKLPSYCWRCGQHLDWSDMFE